MSARGFTLIELMLAIAVIAILAVIAIPNYQQHIKKSKRIEVQAHLMTLSHQLASYKLVNQSFAGMNIEKLGGANFPATQPNYTLTLTDAYGASLEQEKTLPTTWLLVATPIANSTQKGTGKISLMYNNAQCWYENQDDAVAHMSQDATAQLSQPSCPAAWQQ